VKPIGVFVHFLKGLEGENDNRRKSFREAEGESTVNVLLSYHLEMPHSGKTSRGHLLQEKQDSVVPRVPVFLSFISFSHINMSN